MKGKINIATQQLFDTSRDAGKSPTFKLGFCLPLKNQKTKLYFVKWSIICLFSPYLIKNALH